MAHYQHIEDEWGNLLDLVTFCSDYCHRAAAGEDYAGWNGCHELEFGTPCAYCEEWVPGTADPVPEEEEETVIEAEVTGVSWDGRSTIGYITGIDADGQVIVAACDWRGCRDIGEALLDGQTVPVSISPWQVLNTPAAAFQLGGPHTDHKEQS